jgi:hypothetical protein
VLLILEKYFSGLFCFGQNSVVMLSDGVLAVTMALV